MKRFTSPIFLISLFAGLFSNAYANLPIKYTGAAYWGESHIYSVTPSDPRIGIPRPTEFSAGTAEDVLSKYIIGEHDYYIGPYLSGSSSHVAHVCLWLSSSGAYCSRSTYHWAVEHSIECYAPEVPNKNYTQCVAPPIPASLPAKTYGNPDACGSISTSVGDN